MIVTIFDTETTDLIANSARRLEKQPRIIEFFALSLQQIGEGEEATFKEIDTWHSLFNPGVPIPETVKGITNINDEMVAGAPKFQEKAAQLLGYLTRAHRVVAHNITYDRDMVNIELARCNERMVWPEMICTVEATEHFKGFRLNLTSLHEYLFGEPFSGAHRAEHDVRATAKCYMELVRRGEI